MQESLVKMVRQPAVTVPAALVLVTVLAGVVGMPAWSARASAAQDTVAASSSALEARPVALNRQGWPGVPESGLQGLNAPADAVAEVPEAAGAGSDVAEASAEDVAEAPALPERLIGRADLGYTFTAGAGIRSYSKEFELVFSEDGRLDLLQNGEPIAELASAGPDSRVVFTEDGNLVQYAGDQVVRETGTAGKGGVALQVGNDGNLRIVDASNEPIWALQDLPGSKFFLRRLNIPSATSPDVVWDEFTGPNTSSRILLTFDDCPKSVDSFKAAIDYVHEEGIGILIFPNTECVQNFAAKDFDMVTYARERGVWVGNHTASHANLPKLSGEKLAKELAGFPGSPNLVRPPYGAVNNTVRQAVADAGARVVLWDVDTNDWQGKSQQSVIDYVVNNAYAGSNVLMHMQHAAFNPTAIGAIRDGLAAKGLELCPMTQIPTTADAPAELCQ